MKCRLKAWTHPESSNFMALYKLVFNFNFNMNKTKVTVSGESCKGVQNTGRWSCYWLLMVKVVHPTQHKIGHLGDVLQANLLAWYGKTKPNTTEAHTDQSKEMYYNTK